MDMEEEKQNKLLKLLIVLVVIVIGVGIFRYINGKKFKVKDPVIVTDNSNFYTVSSCVSKYINYIYEEDTKNLLIILNQNYVKKNNIDEYTVLSFTNKLSTYQTFKAKKMYVQQIDDNIYKYYVYGKLIEDTIDSYNESDDFYVIVYINEDGMTFSIEPYDGEIFNG